MGRRGRMRKEREECTSRNGYLVRTARHLGRIGISRGIMGRSPNKAVGDYIQMGIVLEIESLCASKACYYSYV